MANAISGMPGYASKSGGRFATLCILQWPVPPQAVRGKLIMALKVVPCHHLGRKAKKMITTSYLATWALQVKLSLSQTIMQSGK